MLRLGSMPAEERLAAFLLDLSDRLRNCGSAASLLLRMSREEIGSYLGLKLETVSRTLSRFQGAKCRAPLAYGGRHGTWRCHTRWVGGVESPAARRTSAQLDDTDFDSTGQKRLRYCHFDARVLKLPVTSARFWPEHAPAPCRRFCSTAQRDSLLGHALRLFGRADKHLHACLASRVARHADTLPV